MKKTLISVLLIVSLLSTALFSVVFAAYSVVDQGTVTATVSGFGVTIAVTEATDSENITMMPGKTDKNLISVVATGTPSVNATLSYTATVTVTDWELDNGSFYCPVDFTVTKGGTPTVIKGSQATSTDDLAAKIATAITGDSNAEGGYVYSQSLTAGNALTTAHDVTVTWTWAEGDEAAAAKNGQLDSTSAIEITINASIVQDQD